MTQDIDNLYVKSTLLYSSKDIQQSLDKMAHEIEAKIGGKNPVIVCVMTGGLVTTGHLLTRLNFHLQMDYVHATRYHGEMQGGQLEWIAKPRTSLKGRTVLIVDDILDAGVTLAEIKKAFLEDGATEVYTAVLIDKIHKRPEEGLQQADFVGLTITDHFIFGFGLDYKGYLRNTSGIYQVNQ
jgi:hypoxanthine phosphoribosyltransferase